MLFVSGISADDFGPPRRPDESELFLFALRLDQLVLSDELVIYRRGEKWLVPLGELCRLLDLAVDVDASRGLAAGFLIREDRRFLLDTRLLKIEVAGERRPFDSEGFLLEGGDIYVEANLLGKWLPLELEVEAHSLVVRVLAREKLPLQLRLEREKKLASSRKHHQTSHLPRLDLPYRLLDGPFADASLRYSRRADTAGTTQNTLDYSLHATGELLYLEADLYLGGTSEEILDSRLSLGRKDPDGHLLGILGAREVTLGEIFHPGLELVALPRSGPGILISNFPLGQVSTFGRQSFRGDLPPGWEAELYRGEELLAYVRSRPDGLYEFLDVPLLVGLNLFRIELYGPQGQRRTERQALNIGDSLTPNGKVYYRLAGNDPGFRLVGQGPPTVGPRASLEVSAGLAKHVSATASLATLEQEGRTETYGQAGLHAYWGPILAGFDLAAESRGGLAWQGQLQSRWRGFGLQLRHAEIDGLESEALRSPVGPLRRRTWLSADAILPAWAFLPRMPVVFEARQDELRSGVKLTELRGRISAFRRGFAIANQLNYSFSSSRNELDTGNRAFGQLLVSKFLRSLALRGEADYELKPNAELTSLAVTGEARRGRNWLLSGGVTRVLRSGQTRYQAGVSRLDGPFGFTATADYAGDVGLGVSLLLSISLSRDSREGEWHSQARSLASSGGLSARVFLDENGNGRMDPGEQPIEGAGLTLNGGNLAARTNRRGEVYLANLAAYQAADLAVSTSTLEDPYWQPGSEGVSIGSRPGKVAVIDFPIEVGGEIIGTVFLQYQGSRREAGGVEVELVAADGTVHAKTRSASDGFYDLVNLRPGSYTLRVAQDQVSRLRVVGAPSRSVELKPDGSVLEDLNFLLVSVE